MPVVDVDVVQEKPACQQLVLHMVQFRVVENKCIWLCQYVAGHASVAAEHLFVIEPELFLEHFFHFSRLDDFNILMINSAIHLINNFIDIFLYAARFGRNHRGRGDVTSGGGDRMRTRGGVMRDWGDMMRFYTFRLVAVDWCVAYAFFPTYRCYPIGRWISDKTSVVMQAATGLCWLFAGALVPEEACFLFKLSMTI